MFVVEVVVLFLDVVVLVVVVVVLLVNEIVLVVVVVVLLVNEALLVVVVAVLVVDEVVLVGVTIVSGGVAGRAGHDCGLTRAPASVSVRKQYSSSSESPVLM